jgi:hypothetical protein
MIEVRIEPAGLMRCCAITLHDDTARRTEQPPEGEKVSCKFCDNRMVFSDGAWRWSPQERP